MENQKLMDLPNEIKSITKKIIKISYPKQGCTSIVAIIDSQTGRYILKQTNHPLYNIWLDREINVLKALEGVPFKVQKVFYYHQTENYRMALLEYLEGETLYTYLQTNLAEDVRSNIIIEFGQILKNIHETPCPNKLNSNKDWINECLLEAEYNFKNYETEGTEEMLNYLIHNQPNRIPQTLIHGDFTVDNVLVFNNHISGVIDWGGGAFGDPRYDVALAIRPEDNAFLDEKDQDLFFKGYGGKIITDKDYYYFEHVLYSFY